MQKRLLAEGLGTAFLLIGVVGSGIMAETLSPENIGIALLANAIATGCILFVLITILGPVSGAHFNPAVTLAMRLSSRISTRDGIAYVVFQVLGGIAGVWVAHLMFSQEVLQISQTARMGPGLWSAEVVATFGLVLAIFGGLRHKPEAVPALVALYITGAYWFTASTSFANPAVTVARSFTDTFSGIAPAGAPMFILMQCIGAALCVAVSHQLFSDD